MTLKSWKPGTKRGTKNWAESWTKRSKKRATLALHRSRFQSFSIRLSGVFYPSRDEDWLRAIGRLEQTSSLSPFSSFVSDRPAIYPANIFQLFFHSASSLLFSNHRPTSIVPFIRGKTRHARSFSIVPPASRFRLPPPILAPSSNLQRKLAAKHFQLSVDF